MEQETEPEVDSKERGTLLMLEFKRLAMWKQDRAQAVQWRAEDVRHRRAIFWLVAAQTAAVLLWAIAWFLRT